MRTLKTKFDEAQLAKAEMFAHTLAQKLESLRGQVEMGAPSPSMVAYELDSSEQLLRYIGAALKLV